MTWTVDRYTLILVAPGIPRGQWALTIYNARERARLTIGRWSSEAEGLAVAGTLIRLNLVDQTWNSLDEIGRARAAAPRR